MQQDHSNGMAMGQQGYPAAAPGRANPYAPQPMAQSTGGVGGGSAPGFEVLTHMLLRTLQNWPTLPQIAVPSDDDAPVLQVLSVKKMTGAEGQNNPTDRHRFIVSDGVHYAQAMIATHLNELIFSQAFSKNNLIRLRGLKSNFVNEKRVLIITDCVPMSHGAGHLPRLGGPIMEIGNMPTSLPPTFDPVRATAVATQIIERFSSTAGVPGAGLPSHQAVENGGMAGAAPQYRPPAPQQPAPSPYAQQSPYQGSMGGAQQGMSRMQAGPGGMSSSSSSSTEAPAVVLPIRALTPYQQKWTIRASVVQKSEIRTFTNKNGEGKLFSVIFADESGEIRATGFGDAVTMFYDMLIEGHVFYVSMASVKVAKKQFSGAVQNEYEMTFESRTSIMPCNDSVHTAIRFERVMLSDLMSKEKDATIDVLGVVKEVQDVSHFVSKTTNKPLVKRDIVIVDESRYSVRTTLWGRQAETF
ncbi:Replication factor A protein 1, partial [Cladochytrium tenue]